MTDADDDWRLMGQERFLQNATLRRGPSRRPASNPNWDHDHCVFCGVTFMEGDSPYTTPDTLVEGYTTTTAHERGDGYYWVCPMCFADFAGRFNWRVEADSR